MQELVYLVLGVALAGLGGEVFVRGAVGLSTAARIPPGIVGATVAAFATSSPEFTVGINAALAGNPALSAGDALGSNVVNLGLVIGMVLLMAPVRVERQDIRRDLPFTILAPLLLGALLWDGALSRTDGLVLVLVFVLWLGTTVSQAMHERDITGDVIGAKTLLKAVLLSAAGIMTLVVAGRMIVVAAAGIGHALGLAPFIVGATFVAFGTSVPELATALLARRQGHDGLSAGTVMGSNIFNTLWIVGSVAVMRPYALSAAEVALAVLASVAGAILLLPGRSWVLPRSRGVILIIGYAAYAAALPICATGLAE